MQLFEIMEEKSAASMIAQLDEMLNHGNQWGVFSFQIRRKQANDTIIFDISILLFKQGTRMVQVLLEIPDAVLAVDRAGCSAALKTLYCIEYTGSDCMRFEKRDG